METTTIGPSSTVKLPRQSLTNAPFIDVGGHTDIGRVRKINTDFFLTAELNRSLILGESSLQLEVGAPWLGGVQGKLMIVADGITGAGMGNAASWAAVDGIAHYITNVLPWAIEMHNEDEAELVKVVKHGLMRCQDRIRRQAREWGLDDRPVGTTMTMAYILWPTAYILHVGDSRAYLLRQSELSQLTSDDTIAQHMLERGLTEKSARCSQPSDVLTNSIGGGSDSIEIEHHRVELEIGDQLLLCSNGLTRHLGPGQLRNELEKTASASMSCVQLVDAANQAGGKDNITAVIAHVAPAKTS